MKPQTRSHSSIHLPGRMSLKRRKSQRLLKAADRLKSATSLTSTVVNGSRLDQPGSLLPPMLLPRRTTPAKALDLADRIQVEMQLQQTAMEIAKAKSSDQSEETISLFKTILVSRAKLSLYKMELEHRRAEGDKRLDGSAHSFNTAKVSVSDIRIPLAWKERDHFKNKGDSRRFALFVTMRINDQLCDTELIYNVGRDSTDVSFSTVSVFEKLTPGFELSFDVYSCLLDADFIPMENLAGMSGSMRFKRKLKGSLRRSIGSKLGSFVKKSLDTTENQFDQFERVATATLRMSDLSVETSSYDLQMLNNNIDEQPPLFGHFCCKVTVQPASVLKPLFEGQLRIKPPQKDEMEYFCHVMQCRLYCWPAPVFAKQGNPPLLALPIDKQTVLQPARKKSSLIITVPMGFSESQFSLSTVDPDQHETLKIALQRQITDHKFWGRFAEKLIATDVKKHSYLSVKPGHSLYDDISMMSDLEFPMDCKEQLPPIDTPSLTRRVSRVSEPEADGKTLNCSYQLAISKKYDQQQQIPSRRDPFASKSSRLQLLDNGFETHC